MELFRVRKFIGEMHQLENERAIFRFYPGEILARLNHHLGDPDLVAILQRIAQKRVRFIAAFLRFQIVGLIKKHRIDLFLIDEVLNVHCLCRLQINALKILVLEHDVFSLLILIPLHDLVPGNLLAVFFSDTLVVYRTQIALAQQTKLEFLTSRGGIQGDRNVNQTETDAAFPDCARHTNLFVWRAGTARPAFVMWSEVETSLFLTRPWQRGHSLRSLDSLGMTDVAVVVVTRPARARGARYRAIQKGGSMSLRSDCSDTMRPQ